MYTSNNAAASAAGSVAGSAAGPNAANAAAPGATRAAAPAPINVVSPAGSAAARAGPPSPAVGAFAHVMMRMGGLEIAVPPGSREELILSLADRMIAAASAAATPSTAGSSAPTNAPVPASASSKHTFFTPAGSPRGRSPPDNVEQLRAHVAEAIAAQVPAEVAAQLPHGLRRVEQGLCDLRTAFTMHGETQRQVAEAVLLVSGELGLVSARLAWGEQIAACRRQRDLRALDAELVQYYVEGRMPVADVVSLHRLMLARRDEIHSQHHVRHVVAEMMDYQDPDIVDEFNFELTRALRNMGEQWM